MSLQSRITDLAVAIGQAIKSDRTRLSTIEGALPSGDGTTIDQNSVTNVLSVKTGGLQFSHLADVAAKTVVVNNGTSAGTLQALGYSAFATELATWLQPKLTNPPTDAVEEIIYDDTNEEFVITYSSGATDTIPFVAGGGGTGTTDHRDLTFRDAANQHPASSITDTTGSRTVQQAIDAFVSDIANTVLQINNINTSMPGRSQALTETVFNALVTNSELVPGRRYFITDLGVFRSALTNSTWQPDIPGVATTSADGLMSSSYVTALNTAGTNITALQNWQASIDAVYAVTGGNFSTVPPAASSLTLTLNRRRLGNTTQDSVNIAVPIASASAAGAMPAASFSQIQTNTAAIAALEGAVTGGIRPTSTPLPNDGTVTQIMLQNAWTTAGGTLPLKNGDTLVSLPSNDTWTYFSSLGSWMFRGNSTLPLANNSGGIGAVTGSEEDGQIFVENDGTMSLVGWDTLATQDDLDTKLDKFDAPITPITIYGYNAITSENPAQLLTVNSPAISGGAVPIYDGNARLYGASPDSLYPDAQTLINYNTLQVAISDFLSAIEATTATGEAVAQANPGQWVLPILTV